jgi:uncharacterized protein (DUF58 family)
VIRPSLLALRLAAGWCALALLAAFWPPGIALFAVAGAALALVALVDAGLALRAEAPAAERRVASSLALGAPVSVGLRVAAGAAPCRVRVFDHHPERCEASGLPFEASIAAGGIAEASYRLRPLARGEHRFGPIELLVGSPLRFWWRRVRAAAPQVARVFPDFRAVARYSLLAVDHRLSALGIRKRPRRGEGMEFHQLREYRRGDAPRQIDWKATSRQRRLISREYQDERDQQVLFLLDCGHKMHARDGELAHFDHALNAVLLLAHVALRQGDAVGLMSFGGTRRWLAPRKGLGHTNRLLDAVYDLETGLDASDHLEIAREVMARVTRRSLVVIVTNLRDEDSEELALAVRLLSQRHLVLVASLRETVLDAALANAPHDFESALRTAGAHEYLDQRRHAHERLARSSGVQLLDVPPVELPVRLVNRYLEIKSGGRL